ncbi:MAG: hypothetical protein J5999_01465 [Oscillospiraceae bacterium]|nr:hypothetical protein [Oscillospiraceae bacterium]
MKNFKKGEYVIYMGKEYKKSTKLMQGSFVRIISWEKSDLKNGFICYESENFMKKFGFSCEKEVPKSEITKAYKIETTAKYKGSTYCIDTYIGNDLSVKYNRDEMVRIYTLPISTLNEVEKYNYYKQNGFADGMSFEYGNVMLYKYVSINDPDLEIVENRTEIDVSVL